VAEAAEHALHAAQLVGHRVLLGRAARRVDVVELALERLHRAVRAHLLGGEAAELLAADARVERRGLRCAGRGRARATGA
jgi:hypothetical protein